MGTDLLLFSDCALRTILQSADPSPCLQARSVPSDMLGITELPKTGEGIYKLWRDLANIAAKKAEDCTRFYKEFSDRVCSLEDQKNACYLQKDKLQKELDSFKAQEAGLAVENQELIDSIIKSEARIHTMKTELEKKRNEKKAYDSLRGIRIWGISISELIKAIDQTERKLNSMQKELNFIRQHFEELQHQKKECSAKLMLLSEKIAEADRTIQQLESRLEVYQSQREQASQEMISWKNREQYYLSLIGEMEHLIDIEASVEEFQKLIASNPPDFELAG